MINNLPQISFAELATSDIESSVITAYEAIAGRKLYPGDPVRLFLEAIALLIVQQRALIDYSAKQNLLAYSTNSYLDHLGVLVGVPRLLPEKAQVTVKFTLSAVQETITIIEAGTRVTFDGSLDFVTKNIAYIQPGQLSVEIDAECSVAGTVGNGFLPGQINVLVKPLPWIKSVENITKSQGGADAENDDAYRERIRTAPEEYSSAGPEGAYEAKAKRASALIGDVSVITPEPGKVDVYILLKSGELPGEDILKLVDEECNKKTVRPLTDYVSIKSPTVVNYDINLTYYISKEEQANTLLIQEAVNKAVAEYELWQKSKLNRDINPSQLISKIMTTGARRVALDAPVYTALDKTKVAVAQSITVSFGGIEDGF